MNDIKVSVIIPVCNVENYVRHTIESALEQTLRDIEIIIVDDGSTDSSPAIIDYYAAQDERIVAIHKQNEGYGKACNLGFDRARGEYVAILESDDFIDPEMYEQLYEYAKELDADVVKGPYKDCFAKDVLRPYPYNDYLTRNMPRHRLYSIAECPCQLAVHQSIWAGIYRRSYLNEFGIRFEEVPGAGHVDIKFCVESLVYSKRLAWLDIPFYNYRVEREGSSTANYRLDENTVRYKEMHEFFKPFKEEFAAAMPHLVAREVVGLYRYFKKQSFTDNEIKNVSALFNDFPEDAFMRAPIISYADKQAALMCRNEPQEAAATLRARGSKTGKAKPKPNPQNANTTSINAMAADLLFRSAVLGLLVCIFFSLAGSALGNSPLIIAVLAAAIICGVLAILLLLRELLRKAKNRKRGK